MTSWGGETHLSEGEWGAESKPLHLCMVIDSFDTSTAGVCVSTQRLVQSLRETERVTLVSTGNPAPDRVALSPLVFPIVRNLGPFEWARPDKTLLDQAIRNADLVHIQLHTWLGRAALQIARKRGVPCIASIHRQPENFLYPMRIRWQRLVDAVYRYEIQHFYNRCHHVVCPSKFAERELRRCGLTIETSVVSNGITADFEPGVSTVRPSIDRRFVILTVGRLSAEKCQDQIIKAVAKSRYRDDILLVVIGHGELDRQLRKLGRRWLGNGVRFLTSGIDQQQLIEYYRAADLYVHAGSVELESMAVLEAMACGRTPLISDAKQSAASQFALDERSLFRHGDVDSLAKKIDDWLAHPEQLRTANESYLRWAGEFSIDKSVSRFRQIYQSVLRKVRGPEKIRPTMSRV